MGGKEAWQLRSVEPRQRQVWLLVVMLSEYTMLLGHELAYFPEEDTAESVPAT